MFVEGRLVDENFSHTVHSIDSDPNSFDMVSRGAQNRSMLVQECDLTLVNSQGRLEMIGTGDSERLSHHSIGAKSPIL